MIKKPILETFCLLVAGGMSQAAAYNKATGRDSKNSVQSASRLMGRDDVRARVAEIRLQYAQRLSNVLIRDLDTRLNNAQGRLDKIYAVMAARAADPRFANVPGGDTGIVLLDGSTDEKILTSALRIEMGVAKQLGQVEQKVQISGPDGGPIQIDDKRLLLLTDEELKTLEQLRRKLDGGDDSDAERNPGGTESAGT